MDVKIILMIALPLLLADCTDKEHDIIEETNSETVSENNPPGALRYKVDTVATGLKNPWSIAFLPDGRMLVTERAGSILIFKDGQLQSEKIQGLPKVYAYGQGGLMDIQLHPDFATNKLIYFSYTKQGSGGSGTVIARATLEGNSFTNVQELFAAQPLVNSGVHFGSRIAFDGKGYMFFSSGERGTMENAQNLGNHLGKILRLHDDGRVPSDNPFVNTAGAKPEIWSYGHRNPQGLIYDRQTNTLWNHEHGPRGGDELNKVEKGKNYGWPKITYGINYDGTPIIDKTSMDGMEQPVTYWVPSIAPCGMAQVTSDKYPGWKNNLLIGALVLQHVARVQLDNSGKYVSQEKILDKIARVRAVVQSPDGFIYVATEGPGMIVKLVPVE